MTGRRVHSFEFAFRLRQAAQFAERLQFWCHVLYRLPVVGDQLPAGMGEVFAVEDLVCLVDVVVEPHQLEAFGFFAGFLDGGHHGAGDGFGDCAGGFEADSFGDVGEGHAGGAEAGAFGVSFGGFDGAVEPAVVVVGLFHGHRASMVRE